MILSILFKILLTVVGLSFLCCLLNLCLEDHFMGKYFEKINVILWGCTVILLVIWWTALIWTSTLP